MSVGRPPRALRRIASELVTPALCLAWLVVTNHHWSWTYALRRLHEGDVISYETIARAAPHFPKTKVLSLHAKRFPVHWVVGATAKLTHVPLHVVYWIALAIVVVAILVVVDRLLRDVGSSRPVRVICIGGLLLNPYFLRYDMLAPGMLADLVLVAGVALALLGLRRERYGIVMTGLVVGGLARDQTMVPVALVAAAWIVVSWTADRRGRWLRAAGLIAAMAAIYATLGKVSDTFSKHFEPRLPADTVLDQIGKLPSGAGQLADHVGRVGAPLLLVAGLIVGGLLVMGRRRVRALPAACAWTAAIAAAVAIQPLTLSSRYVNFNEPRLSVLALLPLVVVLADVLHSLGPRIDAGRVGRLPGPATAVCVLAAAASLHHIYTVVGEPGAGTFLAAQIVAAFVSAAVVWTAARA